MQPRPSGEIARPGAFTIGPAWAVGLGLLAAAAVLPLGSAWPTEGPMDRPTDPPTDPSMARATGPSPVLTVELVAPAPAEMVLRIPGSGRVEPWREASVGTQLGGLRLVDIKVELGDRVRRGQVLAMLDPDPVEAELAQSRAALRESRAVLAEAEADAARARRLRDSGAMSRQQIEQALSAEQKAQARLESAVAANRTQALRLQRTRIEAPEDGVIALREASIGAVPPLGQALFRLIVAGRLEWRAAVAAADLAAVRPGQRVWVEALGAAPLIGTVRMMSPVIDARSGNGTVYVDLPPGSPVRAGTFARGVVEVGSDPVLTLPQSAVQLREGFWRALRVGADGRVIETRVRIGRRDADRIEIVAGLDPTDRVVASGGGFLQDGDRVHVRGGDQ